MHHIQVMDGQVERKEKTVEFVAVHRVQIDFRKQGRSEVLDIVNFCVVCSAVVHELIQFVHFRVVDVEVLLVEKLQEHKVTMVIAAVVGDIFPDEFLRLDNLVVQKIRRLLEHPLPMIPAVVVAVLPLGTSLA